jgi:hypothetical protein
LSAQLLSCKSKENQEEADIESFLPKDAVFELLADTTAGLNSDSLIVFLDFYNNPCVMFNGVVSDILNDTAVTDFRYIVNVPLPITSICCYDNGDMFTIAQNELYQYKENKSVKLAELPANDLKLEKADYNKLYIYGAVSDSINELYFFDVKKSKVETLVSSRDKISAVFGNGDTTYVSIANSVLMLANGEIQPILENIDATSLTVIDGKLFFANDEFIGVCFAPYKFIPLIQIGATQLLSDYSQLYIVFANGAFASLSNIASFDNFCATIDSIVAP